MRKKTKIAIVGIGQRGLQHLENLIKLEENEMVKIQSLIDPFSENLLEKETISLSKNMNKLIQVKN